MSFIDDGNGIGAGVGADNAAKLEHDQRRMAERLSAKLSQFIPLGGAGGVGHHVGGVLHRIHAALDPFQHGSRHGGIAAHLCLDLRDTGVQADDGADAQQVTHHCGGGADTAGLFHLLQAVGSKADLYAVQLLLQLTHTGGQLAAVAHLAGTLAEIPAVGHRIILTVDDLDLHCEVGALLLEQLDSLDGVVIGAGAAGVDAQVDQIGIALIDIAGINITELQLGNGRGGRHALRIAHHLVELVVRKVLALHVLNTVKVDGKAHDLDAVLVRKLLRNIGTGIRQKTDLAHFTSSLHS